MLNVGIIETVEELEWISPIVIHDKKTTGEFGIYLDLRKLNDACLHDPFPTPFTDVFIHRWLLWLSSSQNHEGRQPQNNVRHGMGMLPVDDNALWTQECTCYFF